MVELTGSSLEDHRQRFTQYIILTTCILLFPIVVSVVYQAIILGPDGATVFQVSTYGILLYLAISKNRLNYRTKSKILFAVFMAVMTVGFYRGGILSAGPMMLVTLSSCVTILLGLRYGLIFVGLFLLIFSGIAWAHIEGYLKLGFDVVAYLESPTSWIVTIVSSVLYSMMLVVAHAALMKGLEKSVSKMETHASELEKANLLLKQEIVKRKHSEEQLLVEKEKAEKASRAKDQFLSVMSHELRTPLNPILGFIDIIEETETEISEDTRECLQLMKGSGLHLLGLIGDILDFSSLEMGELSISKSPKSIAEVLHECMDLKQEQAEAKGLFLELQIDRSVQQIENEGYLFEIDARRILQMLVHLIDNAIKFTSEGGVTIIVSFKANTKDEGILKLTIIDTGIGIEESQIPQLMEPFQQGDTGMTRSHEGIGLGLTICRKIVDSLGGVLAFQSKFSEGATVTFSFPVCVVQSIFNSSIERQSHSSSTFVQQKTILLVEDDSTNRKLIVSYLKKTGLEVLSAENGEIAIDILGRDSIDLVLMDLRMPDMDGFEVARWIRQREGETQSVPIIAVSAQVAESAKFECKQCGMNDFLEKPVGKSLLIEKIEYWLRN